jgi:hypothetical protein
VADEKIMNWSCGFIAVLSTLPPAEENKNQEEIPVQIGTGYFPNTNPLFQQLV